MRSGRFIIDILFIEESFVESGMKMTVLKVTKCRNLWALNIVWSRPLSTRKPKTAFDIAIRIQGRYSGFIGVPDCGKSSLSIINLWF
jgi:hypothetical protein